MKRDVMDKGKKEKERQKKTIIKKNTGEEKEKIEKRNREKEKTRHRETTMKIAKKLMIINEALNRVTSRRIERRFLPSVRAASENANRKRIQDLSLEVTRVRSWGRRGDRDIFFSN